MYPTFLPVLNPHAQPHILKGAVHALPAVRPIHNRTRRQQFKSRSRHHCDLLRVIRILHRLSIKRNHQPLRPRPRIRQNPHIAAGLSQCASLVRETLLALAPLTRSPIHARNSSASAFEAKGITFTPPPTITPVKTPPTANPSLPPGGSGAPTSANLLFTSAKTCQDSSSPGAEGSSR